MPIFMDEQVVLRFLAQGLREENEDAQGEAAGKALPPDAGDDRPVPDPVGPAQVKQEPEQSSQVPLLC